MTKNSSGKLSVPSWQMLSGITKSRASAWVVVANIVILSAYKLSDTVAEIGGAVLDTDLAALMFSSHEFQLLALSIIWLTSVRKMVIIFCPREIQSARNFTEFYKQDEIRYSSVHMREELIQILEGTYGANVSDITLQIDLAGCHYEYLKRSATTLRLLLAALLFAPLSVLFYLDAKTTWEVFSSLLSLLIR